jgi:hypothetical protein
MNDNFYNTYTVQYLYGGFINKKQTQKQNKPKNKTNPKTKQTQKQKLRAV